MAVRVFARRERHGHEMGNIFGDIGDALAGAAKAATGFIEGNKGQEARGLEQEIGGGAAIGGDVSNVTDAVASAVGDVIDDIGKIPVIGGIIKGVVHGIGVIVAAPYAIAYDVASGNIDAIGQEVTDLKKAYGDVAEAAAAVASFIPGIGTGVAAVLGASAALAEGRDITDALVDGVMAAIPGGELVQTAFTAGKGFVEGLADGESLDHAALDAARDAAIQAASDLGVPEDTAAAAFDLASGLAQGKRLQEVIVNAGEELVPDELKANELYQQAQDLADQAQDLYAQGKATLDEVNAAKQQVIDAVNNVSDDFNAAVQAYGASRDIRTNLKPGERFGLPPEDPRTMLNELSPAVLVKLGLPPPETATEKNLRLYGTNNPDQIDLVLAYRSHYASVPGIESATWGDVQKDITAEEGDTAAAQAAAEQATLYNELAVIKSQRVAQELIVEGKLAAMTAQSSKRRKVVLALLGLTGAAGLGAYVVKRRTRKRRT